MLFLCTEDIYAYFDLLCTDLKSASGEIYKFYRSEQTFLTYKGEYFSFYYLVFWQYFAYK